jgi:hypothetical protein
MTTRKVTLSDGHADGFGKPTEITISSWRLDDDQPLARIAIARYWMDMAVAMKRSELVKLRDKIDEVLAAEAADAPAGVA